MDLNQGQGPDLWTYIIKRLKEEESPMEGADPDTTPSTRGATLVHAEREECAWPSARNHSLILTWDKNEDRMVAKIVPTFAHRKQD